MSFLDNLPRMNAEFEAWKQVVKQFRALGFDINDARFNPLVKAVHAWGEELVSLRVKQSEELRARALSQARVAYTVYKKS